jgi:hypothetical protein
VDSFIIYRAVSSVPIRVAALPTSAFSQWTDNSSDTRVRAYYYSIAYKNSCGEGPRSPEHKTIHLTVSQGQLSDTWNLQWNSYEGVSPLTYADFEILRGTTATNLAVIAYARANSFNSYADFGAPTGTLVYGVRVAPAVVCSPSKTDGEEYLTSNLVFAGEAPALALFPNPTTTLGATLQGEITGYTLTDAAGRVVESRNSVSETTTIGAGLAPGLYVLTAQRADKGIETLRLVIGR